MKRTNEAGKGRGVTSQPGIFGRPYFFSYWFIFADYCTLSNVSASRQVVTRNVPGGFDGPYPRVEGSQIDSVDFESALREYEVNRCRVVDPVLLALHQRHLVVHVVSKQEMRSVSSHQQRVIETTLDIDDLDAPRLNRYRFRRRNSLLQSRPDAALAVVVPSPGVRPALAVYCQRVVVTRGNFGDFGLLLLEHSNRRRQHAVVRLRVAQPEYTISVASTAEDYAVAIEEHRVTASHRNLSYLCALQGGNDVPSGHGRSSVST